MLQASLACLTYRKERQTEEAEYCPQCQESGACSPSQPVYFLTSKKITKISKSSQIVPKKKYNINCVGGYVAGGFSY